MAGVFFVLWEAWAVTAWALDNPHQITVGRDHSDASWWAARVFEGALVALGIGACIWLIRLYRQQHQLSFPHRVVIGMLLSFWLDLGANWVQPTWLYSSQLINVNQILAYAPFLVNRAPMRVSPFPWLSTGLIWVILMPVFGVACAALIRRWRAGRPELSFTKMVLLVAPMGILLDIMLEVPMRMAHLWLQPGLPIALDIFGRGTYYRYSFIEGIIGIYFSMWVMIALRRDDRGRTFMDRRLGHYSPRVGELIAQLSYIGFISLSIVATNVIYTCLSFYAPNYPEGIPAHVGTPLCLPEDHISTLCPIGGEE
jgi:hypothetical protein